MKAIVELENRRQNHGRRRQDRNPLNLLADGHAEPGTVEDELNQLVADVYIVRLRYLTADCAHALLLHRIRRVREAFLQFAADLEPTSLDQQAERRDADWPQVRLEGVPR